MPWIKMIQTTSSVLCLPVSEKRCRCCCSITSCLQVLEAKSWNPMLFVDGTGSITMILVPLITIEQQLDGYEQVQPSETKRNGDIRFFTIYNIKGQYRFLLASGSMSEPSLISIAGVCHSNFNSRPQIHGSKLGEILKCCNLAMINKKLCCNKYNMTPDHKSL